MSMSPTEAAFLSGAFKPQREWQACPVCAGRGVVPQGFYNPHPTSVATSTAPEQCRTCKGARIIERPTGKAS
jgi:DnaJ-class molecular chaperone